MNPWRKTLGLLSVLVIAVTAAFVLSTGQDPAPVQVQQRHTDASSAENLVARLMDQHGCWAPDVDTDVVPTHAIITPKGSSEPELVDSLGVEVAIQQLNGEDYGIVVHAFCP